MTDVALRRILAERALANIGEFTPETRADAYDLVALMLSADDARDARLTAFTIREAAKQQSLFHKLLAAPALVPREHHEPADGLPYPPPTAMGVNERHDPS